MWDLVLGRAAIAHTKGVFCSDLVKVEVKAPKAVLGEYLCCAFKSEAYAQEIKRLSTGSVMKSIRLEDMASIKIPLPPLSVQYEAIQEFKRYENLILAQQEAAHLFQEECHQRLRALWG